MWTRSLRTEIGAWNTPLSPEGKRIRIVGDQIQLLSKNARTGQLGIDRTINDPSFATAPEIGKSPLELWKSDQRGILRQSSREMRSLGSAVQLVTPSRPRFLRRVLR